MKLKYKFTPNLPANLLEESQIAANLSGITSQATQLSVLSVVDNVQEEIDRMEEERARKRAEEAMRQSHSQAQFRANQIMLARAMARLRNSRNNVNLD